MVKYCIHIEKGPMEGNTVVATIDPDTVSYEYKRNSIEAVNLIKDKITGIIWGRTFVDGSKQKRYLKEVESISSPMIYLEDLFCTLIIDAHEVRNGATFDVPRSYLHANNPKDKTILINLRGHFVYILCQVNPEFEQHVRYEMGDFIYLLVIGEIHGFI